MAVVVTVATTATPLVVVEVTVVDEARIQLQAPVTSEGLACAPRPQSEATKPRVAGARCFSFLAGVVVQLVEVVLKLCVNLRRFDADAALKVQAILEAQNPKDRTH